ncbi:MAG: DUF5060 domain-containing protein, partial [Verrucomicrobiota bacterium]
MRSSPLIPLLSTLSILGGVSLLAQHSESGIVLVEAEAFVEQSKNDVRSWYVTEEGSTPAIQTDGDPPHLEGVSGGAYIEALPDTRRTHGDQLIRGVNFAPQPGEMAILSYTVNFPQAGKYFVWARAYSTGTEDNGFHIGLNGEWPESGQRWQTVVKNRWHWECKQRTEAVHTGVPMQLFLDIPEAGEQLIQISMREDGCELDQLLFAMDRDYRPPGYFRDTPTAATKIPEPAPTLLTVEREADGDGSVTISGDLLSWHKVTLGLDGPWAHESDAARNPFTDYQFDVTFTHQSGSPSYRVPGYFAADGNAAETSATSGTCWRTHLSPDKEGDWTYEVSLIGPKGSELPGHGTTGSFSITSSDAALPDLRARGRLQYVGERYLKFAGDGSYFLKAGPDAPETFLAYTDFDGTRANTPNKGPLKRWSSHVPDWKD